MRRRWDPKLHSVALLLVAVLAPVANNLCAN